MARALRIEYPGAVYHVMARGDGGKRIFETDEDHFAFLARLEEACESHGWRVHAWARGDAGERCWIARRVAPFQLRNALGESAPLWRFAGTKKSSQAIFSRSRVSAFPSFETCFGQDPLV